MNFVIIKRRNAAFIGFLSAILIIFLGNTIENMHLFWPGDSYSIALFLLQSFLYICSVAIFFILPGSLLSLIFMKGRTPFYAFSAYIILSGIVLILSIMFLLKIFFIVPVGCKELLRALFVFMMLESIVLWYQGNRVKELVVTNIEKKYFVNTFLLVFMCILLGWVFQDIVLWTFVDTDFSVEHVLSIPLSEQGDVFEHFGRGSSLLSYLWPYWDLEYANRFGYIVTDPPLCHYLLAFFIALFGNMYSTASLQSFLFFILCLMAVFTTVHFDSKKRITFAEICVLSFFCLLYWCVILSSSGAHDVLIDMSYLMTYCTIMQFLFLLNNRYKSFVLFAVAAFLCQYEAMFFTVLGIVYLLWSAYKKEVFRAFLFYLYVVIVYFTFIVYLGIVTGDINVYIESLLIEKFIRVDWLHCLDIFYEKSVIGWDSFNWQGSLSFIKWFLIMTLGFGVVLIFPGKDKTSKLFSFIGIIYFLTVMFSRYYRMNYLTPLIMFFLIVFLRKIFHGKSLRYVGDRKNE